MSSSNDGAFPERSFKIAYEISNKTRLQILISTSPIFATFFFSVFSIFSSLGKFSVVKYHYNIVYNFSIYMIMFLFSICFIIFVAKKFLLRPNAYWEISKNEIIRKKLLYGIDKIEVWPLRLVIAAAISELKGRSPSSWIVIIKLKGGRVLKMPPIEDNGRAINLVDALNDIVRR